MNTNFTNNMQPKLTDSDHERLLNELYDESPELELAFSFPGDLEETEADWCHSDNWAFAD
jgi:hypothetical protein